MMRWEDDKLGVSREVDKLQDVFQNQYGFNTKRWLIPANDHSQLDLTENALDFLRDFDSKDNLFILYYAGHGYINDDRESTWAW
jgi:hypothetical protein